MVLIICDASSRIGIGHIKRSLAIARAFKNKQFDAAIYCISKEARKHIPIELRVSKVPDNPEALVFDLPCLPSKWLQNLKWRKKPLLVSIDSNLPFSPDISIALHNLLKTIKPGLKATYVGWEYALIRQEVINAKNSNLSSQFVLVVVGGGDINNSGPQSAEVLLSLGYKVILIKGPFVSNQTLEAP